MSAVTVLAAIAGAATSGCFWVTTKHEGKKLREDVDSVSTRLNKQELTLGEKAAKLEKTLDQAAKLLARNSADLGQEVQGLVQENAQLTGLVLEAKRYADEIRGSLQRYEQRMTDFETRLTILEGKSAGASKSADELYSEGMAAYNKSEYDQAIDLFRVLVVKYPGHTRADDAQYYRGEAHFKKGEYETSLAEFQAVHEKFSSSALADDALFRAGEAAEKLLWCTDARAYYGVLRQKYPKSDLAPKAKQKDAYLKKNKDNKKVCKS